MQVSDLATLRFYKNRRRTLVATQGFPQARFKGSLAGLGGSGVPPNTEPR